MRELCASRQPYTVLTHEGSGIDCIPAKLARRGYTTIAYNGFSGRFFDLRLWYPRVGFQQMYFGEELQSKMARTCGSVWLGACDIDVANEVAATLKAQDGPSMVYWLTLNTHIPISPGEGTPRYGCNTTASVFSDPEVCWMAEMWTDIMESIARIALDPALPPMAILVAGDHAPPLYSRKARRLFRPGEVSWVSLWPRAETIGASSAN
jgi:phosphoglycerol transferase MdoB-like AlkP superfamily enzyme